MSKYLPLWLFWLPISLFAQNDSTLLLTPERLTERDILPRNLIQQKSLALSATRSLDAVEDMPFTIVVFTAEDILRNGFVTLTDVLKAAPGIRVSQPGNAVEGETFLIRGLSGNQYMKVLINDVPIKPSIALGMPIGAQLPIRQAERIEILYGPAASIYGDESCAGVVNIILKESERPVYTQADLGFGALGYNSLDLMFGGKIGKDDKIFRFSLYGSSTVRDRTDVYYDQSLYNTNAYLPFGLDTSVYRRRPNFRPASSAPSDSFPRLSQLPHESRLFGINLTFRGLQLTYHRMLRYDHSSLGLNPLAVGYANPSNRIAEQLETFSLGFKRERKRRTSYSNFSFQNYSVDNNSNSTYVFERLSAANYWGRGGPTLPDSARMALLRNIYNRYASEERFAVAKGIDIRMESHTSVLMGKQKRLQFDAGGQLNLGIGTPLNTYNNIPIEIAIDGSANPPDLPLAVNSTGAWQSLFHTMGFAQLAWRGKKLHVIGGGTASFRLGEPLAVLPRLGLLYHVDSLWTVRATVATGVRHSALYGNFHSYNIRPDGDLSATPGSKNPVTEKNYATEVAVRYNGRTGGSLEGIFFWQEVHQLLRPGYLYRREEPGEAPSVFYGFQNAPGLALSNWGLQGILRTGTGEVDLSINGKKTVPLYNRFEFFVQYTRGREWFGYGYPATNELRNQPRWNNQARYYFKVGKKFELIIAANRQGSAISKSVIFKDQFNLPEQGRLGKFNTWDFTSRVYLSNHFLVYIQFLNAFNRHFGGLDATGTPDDLRYNPQIGRQWRLGVNYNMN